MRTVRTDGSAGRAGVSTALTDRNAARRGRNAAHRGRSAVLTDRSMGLTGVSVTRRGGPKRHRSTNMGNSGGHYIPRPDGDFDGWAHNFLTQVVIFFNTQGLDDAPVVAVSTALTEWDKAYLAHTQAQAAAEAAAARKRTARAAFEGTARPVVNFVQAFPATTNADRAVMGITVRDLSTTPAPVPATRPLARVDAARGLTQTLRFVDAATPQRRAKPKGATGAEVWLALTDPNEPAPPPNTPGVVGGGPYSYVITNSSGSLRTDFSNAQAGKTAHYLLCWVNARGEKGPWSEPCSATVAA